MVMAMSVEAGYLSDILTRVRRYTAKRHQVIEGELAGKIVALVITGAGRAAARQGAELLIAGHRPRWIVSAGFAGALDPTLARNDLVLPHEVTDLEGRCTRTFAPIPDLPASIRTQARLITVDKVITGSAQKAELRRIQGADLVDMETSAVAGLAADRSLGFISIRVISDDARSELPAEVAGLISKTGSYRVAQRSEPSGSGLPP